MSPSLVSLRACPHHAYLSKTAEPHVLRRLTMKPITPISRLFSAFFAVITFFVMPIAPAAAQTTQTERAADEQRSRHEVMDVIETLFEGMRSGNAEMVASTFAEGATLASSGARNGVPFVQKSAASDFVAAVGRPSPAPWDERIWNVEIDVQDNLASARMDYAFFLGEEFSHCGQNHIQYARHADGAWKAIALADTRRPAAECILNPNEVEETAVRAALRHYLQGHATGDGAHHAAAMAEEVGSMYFVNDGALQQRTFEAYIAGSPGNPAANESERFRYIDWVEVSGTAAVGRVVLDYPGTFFVDYMSLLKIDGQWQIVNKIFDWSSR